MKTQIIFTCARCGKEQVENLNRFTVRRFKYRNLISKNSNDYKLDVEICPDCYRSLKIWLDNGDEHKELIDENNMLKKQNTWLNKQRVNLQGQLRDAKKNTRIVRHSVQDMHQIGMNIRNGGRKSIRMIFSKN